MSSRGWPRSTPTTTCAPPRTSAGSTAACSSSGSAWTPGRSSRARRLRGAGPAQGLTRGRTPRGLWDMEAARRRGPTVSRVPLFLGFLGVLGFSGTLPATRVAVEELDAAFVGLGRAVVAAALAAALLLLPRQPRPRRDAARPAGAGGARRGDRLPAVHRARAARADLGPRRRDRGPAAGGHGRDGRGPRRASDRAAASGWPRERAWWRCSSSRRRRAPGCPRAADGLVLIAVALGALGYAEGGALSRELGGWQTICWALVLSMPLVAPLAVVAGAHRRPQRRRRTPGRASPTCR